MASTRIPGAKLLALDEASKQITHSIWLDGPKATAEAIGARGYAYEPFPNGEPMAVEPHVLVLYINGRTTMQRSSAGAVERAEVGPGDLSLQSTALFARWQWWDPIDVLHVYVSPIHLRSMAQRAFDREVTSVRLHNRLRVADDRIVQLGFDLIHELTEPAPGSEIAARAIGDRLLVQLLRSHADLERRSAEGAFDAATIARLEAYIGENIGDRLDLPQLARVAGYGVHHFCRLFRQTFAQAPHDFVRRQRVEAAKTMLACSERAIGEIALACGFADQSHLTRCFKEHVGDTPARFRQRLT